MTQTYGLVGSHHLEGGFLEGVAKYYEKGRAAGKRVVLGWSQEPRPQSLEATLVERPAVLLPYRSKVSGGDSLVAGAVVVQMRPFLTWAMCQSKREDFECVPFLMNEPVKNVYEVLSAPLILPAHERLPLSRFVHAGSRNEATASPKLDVVLKPRETTPLIEQAFAGADWLGTDSLEKTRARHEYEILLAKMQNFNEPTEGTRRVEQRILRQSLFGNTKTAGCAACGAELPVALVWVSHIKPRASCTRAEMADLSNLLPLCKLGCDDSFEHGYWMVDESGKIRTRRGALTADLRRFLDGIDGRECRGMRYGAERYFAARAALGGTR